MKDKSKNKAGIIYLIINKLNGKKYVGQSKQKRGFKDRYSAKGVGIERVYNQLNNSKRLGENYNKHLLSSIQEHGFHNFQVKEEFDIAYSIDELNKKEKYWIKIYKTTNPKYGYNYTVGGEGGSGSSTDVLTKEEYVSLIGDRYKPVICLDTNEVFLTLSDASKKTGINPSSIRINCTGVTERTGNRGKEKLKFKFITCDGYIEGTRSRPVYCNTDKKFFKNPTEASKYYNIHANSIYNQIRHKKNPSGIKSFSDKNKGRKLIFSFTLEYLLNKKLRPNSTTIDTKRKQRDEN